MALILGLAVVATVLLVRFELRYRRTHSRLRHFHTYTLPEGFNQPTKEFQNLILEATVIPEHIWRQLELDTQKPWTVDGHPLHIEMVYLAWRDQSDAEQNGIWTYGGTEPKDEGEHGD